MTSLRENIALVTQDVILFNDTILDNITHGKAAGHAESRGGRSFRLCP